MERFHNRSDAGRQLAKALAHLQGSNPMVLGLARGGVEVAAEVAKALRAPLDVLVARKVGAPTNPEYGIGAVAPGGIAVFDHEAVRRVGVSDEDLAEITKREVAEVERRLRLYRGDVPLDLVGKCAILVDDGLATGITALASVRYARFLNPSKLVFAVPVSSTQGADLLRPEVDEFVALDTPPFFYAVGAWYDDFSQTSDEEVLELIQGNASTFDLR
ncbi:MAG: phosphoribosyltransferase [Fimbriimonadales bacterium]